MFNLPATLSASSDAVCLLDDDNTVLRSIAWLLVSEGLQIRGFHEPQEFLAHATNNRVSLVVLDVWMEGMSGLEVQARLRVISPETKVIMLTANTDPHTKAQAESQGTEAYFIKPFDIDNFVEAVVQAMQVDGKKAREA